MVYCLVQRGLGFRATLAGVPLQVLAAAGALPSPRLSHSGNARSIFVTPSAGVSASLSYHIIRLTTGQGPAQNKVRALLQTRNGYLW